MSRRLTRTIYFVLALGVQAIATAHTASAARSDILLEIDGPKIESESQDAAELLGD